MTNVQTPVQKHYHLYESAEHVIQVQTVFNLKNKLNDIYTEFKCYNKITASSLSIHGKPMTTVLCPEYTGIIQYCLLLTEIKLE